MNELWKINLEKTLREVFHGIEELPQASAVNSSSSYRAQAISLEELETSIRFCTNCNLHVGREKIVFGEGHAQAKVLFLGDFPSLQDDQAAKPFQGESGELLSKMIAAMNLKREDVYLTNLLKCKPPTETNITELEALTCLKHLEKQISLVNPQVIVTLGELPARTLARTDIELEMLRGQHLEFHNRRVFATYHPRDLLSTPTKKKAAWNDLQKVMHELGLKK